MLSILKKTRIIPCILVIILILTPMFIFNVSVSAEGDRTQLTVVLDGELRPKVNALQTPAGYIVIVGTESVRQAGFEVSPKDNETPTAWYNFDFLIEKSGYTWYLDGTTLYLYTPGYTGVRYPLKVGDPLGDVLYSDITAYINGHAIPTSVIKGRTLVTVEDLAKYGFDVTWNGTEKTLKVALNKNKKFSPISTKKDTKNKPGTFKEKYVYTDIKTYISGEEVESFAIKGVTLIDFDVLGKFGKFSWNEKTREIRLTIG